MSGTSPIPRIYQNANSLLYTLKDDYTVIQPYWVIVLQFFVFKISLRTWNRAVYGSWLLPRDYIIVHAGATSLAPSASSSSVPLPSPFRTLRPGVIYRNSFTTPGPSIRFRYFNHLYSPVPKEMGNRNFKKKEQTEV